MLKYKYIFGYILLFSSIKTQRPLSPVQEVMCSKISISGKVADAVESSKKDHVLGAKLVHILEWTVGSRDCRESMLETSRAGNSLIGVLSESLVFCEKISKWVIRSHKNERFPHFWWATWAICSQLLICLEQSELIAHSRSFDLSQMSKWENERNPSPGDKSTVTLLPIYRKRFLF